MKKHLLAFIDTETTGLDITKHEIVEIGGVIVSQSWDDPTNPVFEIVDEFEFKVKPERIGDADPVALRVNGYDPSAWIFAYTLSEAMQLLAQKTKGAIMVGHNICFDFAFLEKAFIDTGVENTMHYHKLDTISIAFAKLTTVEGIDKYSLRFLCEYFGIENRNAHTALSDARATFALYKKLMLR
ncbi:MAG: 3'-5' exonuclease [Candidatus Pacebacteria bacterium]|jgi:DNA polymerase III epsilon subunit-like protein|nr:3'-5' exonuclease [Candidatus Paceibacterota bacterium]